MKNELFKKWLAAALCLVALGSTAALAEADTFYLGTGRTGSVTIVAPGQTVINNYAPVTANVPIGADTLAVGACRGANPSQCFGQDDLVMVLQTTGREPPVSLNLSNSPIGRWEFARVKSFTGTSLTLTAKLVNDYAAGLTQVIRVPEYTNLDINSDAQIVAEAWDSSQTGGIVVFLATGTVRNAGIISVDGLGFFAGFSSGDASFNTIDTSRKTDCSGDEPLPQSALKGQGIAVSRYGQGGRANEANGGGGGACLRSGGGGGGNYGAGGQGGFSGGTTGAGRDVGGRGGAPLIYSLEDRLTMGGGGGAGHADTSPPPSLFGTGGGIVFIRARQLLGTGSISSQGASGQNVNATGAGGGGAGGSIYLRFVENSSCGSIVANGGIGGTANNNITVGPVGPGGGGGGGRILFQAPAGGDCTSGKFDVSGGSAGGQNVTPPGGGAKSYGAGEGAPGFVNFITSGFAPPAPVVSAPANGATTTARPTFSGTAVAGVQVYVVIDGVEQATPVPESNGTWSFTLPPGGALSVGSHTVWAIAEFGGVRSARSNTHTFNVSAPDTTITSGPTGRLPEQFTFTSNDPAATFECSLDEGPFEPCTSPKTYDELPYGTHIFRVRARDAAGTEDPSPDSREWTLSSGDVIGNVGFRGTGLGSCAATGGDASLVVMALGTMFALVRRRTRR
jgi:hypothetical protein